MTEISASTVASLRARTGVSILQCKKALEEAGGDEEKAIEILRKSGDAQAVKKADRDQNEGAVFAAEEGGKAVLLKLNCETDFVARNEDFVAIGQGLADDLLANGEDAVRESGQTTVTEAVQKLGENISLGDMKTVEGDTLGVYVHSNRKIGVVVGLSAGDSEKAKDVAMHAAAMSPLYINPEDASEDAIASEKEIWKQQLAEEGKPEEMIEKILGGKEKKFREENALVAQEFVKEPGQTIQEFIGDAQVTSYERLGVGA